MADIDILPKRAVPAAALVDSNGVASNGSLTTTQLAARGMASLCAVDGSGTSILGATLAQIARRGIQTFCPVDENGIAQDSSTADALRKRGISPMVLLDSGGIALTGSSTMETLRKRSLGYFCPLDESGNATTMGAVILISNATIFDNATIGSNVGVLSVAGGTGTYTFTLTNNAGGRFAVGGTNGVNLNTASAVTVGSYAVTVSATNGVTPITRTINIAVQQAPVLPANTVLPVISGSTVVGQTLTTTDGTWTGFPAPGFTYQWQRDLTVGDPDVAAWKAAVGPANVSAGRETAVTTFVTALKTAGVWTKLDRYWLLAGENQASAFVDLVNRQNLTGTGTPVFTANNGYVTSAGNNLSTNFTPSTAGGHYTLNSAMFGGFTNTTHTGGANQYAYGCADGAFTTMSALNTDAGSTYTAARINSVGGNIGDQKTGTARGCWTVTRTTGDAVALYYNGSSASYPNGGNTGTQAVGPSMPDVPFVIGGMNFGGTPQFYSGDQVSSFYVGGYLTPTETLALYNAEVALLTTIGVLP